jgi:hypothetical protein
MPSLLGGAGLSGAFFLEIKSHEIAPNRTKTHQIAPNRMKPLSPLCVIPPYLITHKSWHPRSFWFCKKLQK